MNLFSDSCSDEPGHEQHDGRHHHHHNSRQGNNLNSSRRHKSSSPNRKSLRSRSQGGGDCTCGDPMSCCRNSAGRSKSAGHMTANGNNEGHCHCIGESARRSRSRSNGRNVTIQHDAGCCNQNCCRIDLDDVEGMEMLNEQNFNKFF